MTLRSSITALFLCCSLFACSGGGGGGESGSQCGVLNARIFNGETCDQAAQTPVVAIVPVAQNGDALSIAGICTGSLVTIDDFVTSAHCFVDPARSLGDALAGFVVVVGGEDGQGFVVTNLAIHPLYSGRVGSPFDIAMGTINEIPNPPIGPLPVSSSVQTALGDVTTFGYGTNNSGEVGTLKAAQINLVSRDQGNFIGRLSSSGASICGGDSGGPLVRSINGVASLVGVNSFGEATDNCQEEGSSFSGFVDIQNPTVIEFMLEYAPDIPLT